MGIQRVEVGESGVNRIRLSSQFCADSNRHPDDAEDSPFFSRSQTIRPYGSRLIESNYAGSSVRRAARFQSELVSDSRTHPAFQALAAGQLHFDSSPNFYLGYLFSNRQFRSRRWNGSNKE